MIDSNTTHIHPTGEVIGSSRIKWELFQTSFPVEWGNQARFPMLVGLET